MTIYSSKLKNWFLAASAWQQIFGLRSRLASWAMVARSRRKNLRRLLAKFPTFEVT